MILENLKRISILKKPIILRVPVIPGYNDEEDNFKAMAGLIKELKNIKKVELLPYHKLGVQKYKNLGRVYILSKLNSPPADRIEKLKELMEKYGIKCSSY